MKPWVHASVSSWRIRQGAWLLIYSAGIMLLTLSIHDATDYQSSLVVANYGPSGGEYSAKTPHKRLLDYIDAVKDGNRFRTMEATSLVHFASRHISHREIKFSENWVQWCAGQFYPPMLQTQDTQRLIDGKLGNCSDRCQVLKYVAELGGRKCRFVGLKGHVVLEIDNEETWVTADPDYNVVFRMPVSELEKKVNEQTIRDALARRYSKGVIDRYVEIMQSEGDNLHLAVGSPLSPRLYWAERICKWLSWGLPILFLGGIIPFLRQRIALSCS